MNKIKVLILFFSVHSASGLSQVAETTLLARILGQSVAQLKELKDILEIQNASLGEIEKANRKIQQTRYQILRAKYIIDSSKTLQNTNFLTTQDALNFMKKTKRLGKEGHGLFQDINNLSPKEKADLTKELEEADVEVLSLQEKIDKRLGSIVERNFHAARANESEKQFKNYDPLIQANEISSANTMDTSQATIETAKNTSISNRLLFENTLIQSEQLKETYRMNNLLEKNELHRLREEQASRKIWNLNKE